MLQAAAELEVSDDIFPISARKGSGVDALVEHLVGLLPEGAFMFDADDASDQPESVMLAELIREQILRRTFQEVPHAVEVVVDDIDVQPRRPHPRDARSPGSRPSRRRGS